jgi:hypothetical protein
MGGGLDYSVVCLVYARGETGDEVFKLMIFCKKRTLAL